MQTNERHLLFADKAAAAYFIFCFVWCFVQKFVCYSLSFQYVAFWRAKANQVGYVFQMM